MGEGRVTVLAIDPGSEHSAWVLWDGAVVMSHGKANNADVKQMLDARWFPLLTVVIEQVASYGMAVGAEVFETVWWAGRFHEAAIASEAYDAERMYRRDVKLHLCGSMKAKDSNIRQALIDRFGGKEKAIGKKASQGPLYGLKADEWAALALAVTWFDQHAVEAKTA
jgi:hypothetical protein